MKKIIALLAMSILLVSCGTETEEMTVEGTVEGTETVVVEEVATEEVVAEEAATTEEVVAEEATTETVAE